MTRDASSAAAVYLAVIVVGMGPFALSCAYAASWLWPWFIYPLLRYAPTFFEFYAVFCILGMFRTARYVQDGRFRWKEALLSSILSPALLLLTGFLIRIAIPTR
jgi:hypothetical protein